MSGIYSATACAQRILQEDLNLDHYFICQKSDGTVYLREKSFFEKYFGIKCFSDRTDADFSKMVSSSAELLHRIRNNSELSSHQNSTATAEKIYKLVEKVLRAGHFKSPDGVTRNLLKNIDDHYTSITRRSGELSKHYPQLSDPEVPHAASLPIESGMPLQNANSNGFVNTTLRVLAHVSVYSDLLDPQKNPLKQGSLESRAAFEARKSIQMNLHSVTRSMLNGLALRPNAILQSVSHALIMMAQSPEHILKPLETYEFFYGIMQICGADAHTSDHVHYVNTEILAAPGQLEASLKAWQKNDPHKHPDALSVLNFIDNENQLDSEIQMGGSTYRLIAIEAEDEKTGRTFPWLRNENGDFVKLEDHTERFEVVKAQEVTTLLQEAGWIQAHYVRT